MQVSVLTSAARHDDLTQDELTEADWAAHARQKLLTLRRSIAPTLCRSQLGSESLPSLALPRLVPSTHVPWKTVEHEAEGSMVDNATNFENAPCAHEVQVVSRTMPDVESHGLFDYSNSEACNHQLETVAAVASLKSLSCLRKASHGSPEVRMLETKRSSEAPQGFECLLRLVQADGAFWIKKADQSNPRRLWLVVRALPEGSHALQCGDLIKLGRVQLRVYHVATDECEAAKLGLSLGDFKTICVDSASQASCGPCRICFHEDSVEGNPLIAPCHCKGSMQYVHVGCLRKWINSRINLPDSPSDSYFLEYQHLKCEVCQGSYPSHIKSGSQTLPLVELPRTSFPFIALENRDNARAGLYVMSLAERKLLTLGSDWDCDIRICHATVDGCHSGIRFQHGQFFLEDNNSRWGTLVRARGPLALEAGWNVCVQVGGTVFSLALKALNGLNVF